MRHRLDGKWTKKKNVRGVAVKVFCLDCGMTMTIAGIGRIETASIVSSLEQSQCFGVPKPKINNPEPRASEEVARFLESLEWGEG